MVEVIKSFVTDLADGNKLGNEFTADDYRMAYAELLAHAALIAGRISDPEPDKLRALLEHRFDLDDGETVRLLEQTTAAGQISVDLVTIRERSIASSTKIGDCKRSG